MYQINKDKNRITQLKTRKFSDLGFTERHHLQEWIANCPDCLGEELLIIQKEFDGFDETRERLDLLALDKDGNIVVIENKLDDSGRDVVWQVLKYASYCSSLTKQNIIEIFQNHINKTDREKDAREELCNFLETPDLDEVVFNSGNQQRLMMVAANFRKEVTSTALWLLGYGINIQCMKVTPYSYENELFLNVEQIVPTPETKELMVSMSVKEAEEKSTEVEKKHRHSIRSRFWEQALEAMRESSCDLYANINASKDHWLSAGSGVRGVPYSIIFCKNEARVELSISRAEAIENKFIFDKLFEQKERIENAFAKELIWERLDNKKASRIKFSAPFESYNEENWPEIINWLVNNMIKFEAAMQEPLAEVNDQLKRWLQSEALNLEAAE